MNNTHDEALTVEQTCRALGVSKQTLYTYAREYPRWLRNYRRGQRRYCEASGVREFIREHKAITQL